MLNVDIVYVLVPWSSFWCLLVSPLRYQVGYLLGNCLQAGRLPSCPWRSGYLLQKDSLGACCWSSGSLSDSRASVCLSPCWVNQSFLPLLVGFLDLFFVKISPCLVIEDSVLWQRGLLKSFSGFCELVMETLEVVAPIRLVVLSSASGEPAHERFRRWMRTTVAVHPAR